MSGSVVHGFALAAQQAPRAPAISTRQAVWDYRTLSAAVEAVRRDLSARALPRGSRVAILAGNCAEYVALFYGVMTAGLVAVPLNRHERSAVLTRQIEYCGASTLFGDPAHPDWHAIEEGATRCHSQVVRIPEVCLEDRGPLEPTRVEQSLAAEDLAAVFFTSGTTGDPKGVMLSHRNLISNATAIARYLGLTATDCGMCVLPTHFSYGNSVLNSHLISGSRLLMEDSMTYPHLLLQRMQDEQVTGFSGVPATFALLRARCTLQNYDLSRLRYVTQAGGALSRTHSDWIRQSLPRARLYIMYGQTEATARITYLPPERLDDKAGSVGIPLAGTEILILDDRGAPAAPLQTGEICVRGPGVMMGYWNNPAATRRSVREGWLHTGDLGHLDNDGYLFITGRAVEMIKTGAYRVSPREVEEAIESLEAVAEVGVVPIADELMGQSIKAVVVLKRGARPDALAVKSHCRERLAAYKVPKVVEFAPSLPRTASGKLQRFRLA